MPTRGARGAHGSFAACGAFVAVRTLAIPICSDRTAPTFRPLVMSAATRYGRNSMGRELSVNPSNEASKQQAAEAALAWLPERGVVGLGSGSTAVFFI